MKFKFRHKKAINGKDFYLSYIGVAAVLIVVLLIIFYIYTTKLTGFEPSEASFQVFAGNQISYSKDAIFYEDDGEILIKDGDYTFESTGTPILYNTNNKITLVEDMLLMLPNGEGSPSRVLTFTSISMAGGRANFEKNGDKAQSYGGYMYDGADTYLFLEDVTLEIGTDEIELAPLSYVVAVYDNYVEYYNEADGTTGYVSISGTDVRAKFSTGEVVNLGKDTISRDGEEALIFSSVESIDVIDMK